MALIARRPLYLLISLAVALCHTTLPTSAQSLGEEDKLFDDVEGSGDPGDHSKINVDDEDGLIEGSGDFVESGPIFTTRRPAAPAEPKTTTTERVLEPMKELEPEQDPKSVEVVPIHSKEEEDEEPVPAPDTPQPAPEDSVTTSVRNFINNLNTTAVIIIAAVVVILLLLIIVVIVILRRRCEANKRNQGNKYTAGQPLKA